MRTNGFPIDVLLIAPAIPGTAPSSWAMRNRILLEAFGHRALIVTSIAEAAEAAHDVDVALVLASDDDPLVGVAELWQHHASLPVVLCGDGIKEAVRAAAFEAGVALVVRGELMPQELDATLRLVCEQNRVGSPELVRGM